MVIAGRGIFRADTLTSMVNKLCNDRSGHGVGSFILHEEKIADGNGRARKQVEDICIS